MYAVCAVLRKEIVTGVTCSSVGVVKDPPVVNWKCTDGTISVGDGNEVRITDTDTTKGNSPHKLLTNRDIPAIVQGVITPVNQTTVDGVATSGGDVHAVHAVFCKDIVMGATRSATGVLKYPPVVNWKDTGKTILVYRNTIGIPPRTTTQVWTGTGTSVPPISIGKQKAGGPRRSIIPQEVRNST